MALKSQRRSSTMTKSLNVSKCISPKKYNISTFIAVAAVITIIVLAVFMVIPGLFTRKMNTTVVASFYTKTWNGAMYVTNDSYYPNAIEVVAIVFDVEAKRLIDNIFATDPDAIVSEITFENKTLWASLVMQSLPGFLSPPTNISIVGKMTSWLLPIDSVVLCTVAVNVNNDDVGELSMIGGFELQSKFMNAISGPGLNKTTYEQCLPQLFMGSIDIVVNGGFYKNSTTSGLYTIVNGVVMTLEERYSVL